MQFIISIKNFIAKKIACKALKNIDDNENAHRLYQKACMHGDVIVIATVHELDIWIMALQQYKPIDVIESKVYRTLKSYAVCARNKCDNVF